MKFPTNLIKKRASRAFKCSYLNRIFYEETKLKGLKAEEVFMNPNLYRVKNDKWFRDSQAVEATFRWLIAVGILRREVDGQGLTSKVRLTPLGRKILEINPELPNQKGSFLERFKEWVNRKWAIL